MVIKIFSKCGITAILFPLILALLCIAGCLNGPSERPSASYPAGSNDKLIAEDRDSIAGGSGESSPLQLNYDVELKRDLLAVRGDLTQSSPYPLAYILLNATFSQDNKVIFYTKYLLMQVDPGRACSFEICKNIKIHPGEYNCTLEATGPGGTLARESRRCSLVQAAPSSDGGGAVASGWTEYDERAFWAEIERATAEAKDVVSKGSLDESQEVGSKGGLDELRDAVSASSKEEGKDVGSEDEGERFMASSSSKKYHRLDCRYALKIKPENRVYFQSSTEAQEKGYLPCKSCNP